jgi:mono/diheme cytochrome c family protein
MRAMKNKAIGVAIAALAACGLTSCGSADLGSCDMTVLGGSAIAGMASPTAGQLVVEKSCAGGRCHSANAKGLNRVGAPAGLDFDVVPPDTSLESLTRIERGAKHVHENIDEMWTMVDEGDMPPPNQGRVFTSQDKETLRNWLACGAPVIEAPISIGGGGDSGTTPSWDQIYPALSMNQCLSCHSSGAAKLAGDGFIFGDSGDACGAYRNIVNKKAVTASGGCAAMNLTIITPNAPDMSLMLQKLEGTQPCGSPIPAGVALGASNPTVMALRAWIAGGAPPPAGCTP